MMDALVPYLWRADTIDGAAELAIADILKEAEERKAKEAYKWAVPYEQRVKDFIKYILDQSYDRHLRPTSFGFESWYPPNPRMRLTFPPDTLRKFFEDHEDFPCLMQGSRPAMTIDTKLNGGGWNVSGYDIVFGVFKRYVRKRRMTVLDPQEWRKYRDGPCKYVIERIVRKTGGSYSEDHLRDAIRGMVCRDRHFGENFCLIKGKQYILNDVSFGALKDLAEVEAKLSRVLRRLS